MTPIPPSWKALPCIALLLLACATTNAMDRVPVILDTDANNELDDQHALAYLIFNSDVFDILGVTVNKTFNGGDIDSHYDEAARVIAMCDATGTVPLYKGAHNSYADIVGDLGNPTFDGHAAVDFIIAQAHVQRSQKLTLIPIGKLTNIALALEKDPSIADKIRIVWMGSNWPNSGEYNLWNDVPSVNRVLDSTAETWICPAHQATADVRASRSDINAIMPGLGPEVDPAVAGRHGGTFRNFGDYSVNLFAHVADDYRSMYDMAAIATIKNPSWAEPTVVGAPNLNSDGSWTARDDNPRTVTFWRHYDAAAVMQDFYDSMQHPYDTLVSRFSVDVDGKTLVVDGSASTAVNGQQISGYSWDFGDGSSGSGPSLSHVYADYGSYLVTLTVTQNDGKTATESQTVHTHDGLPDNDPDEAVNLALLDGTVLSGNGLRGSAREILYDPAKGDYATTANWNEYGVRHAANLGTVGIDDGLQWMCTWPTPKFINYVSFGGSYDNQPQSDTMWAVQVRFDNEWTTLVAGQGGWIDGGIFEWGGLGTPPVPAEALRVVAYSDGLHDLVSVHYRGRGGVSANIDDSANAVKACLIQYLADDDSQPPALNTPDASINLALLGDTILSGNMGARGSLREICFDPAIGDYAQRSDWNEYGVGFGTDLGLVSEHEAPYWQCSFAAPKHVNYITVGGCYPNQPQPDTMWKLQYGSNGTWIDLAAGQGGWIDGGVLAWSAPGGTPVVADAVRVIAYSDGSHPLTSIHFRGHGGTSFGSSAGQTVPDAPPACLVQYLDPASPNEPPELAPTSVTLRGSTLDPDGSAVTVTVDGQPATVTDGSWSIDLPVQEGSNVFEVVATDADGQQTVREVYLDWTETLATSAN